MPAGPRGLTEGSALGLPGCSRQHGVVVPVVEGLDVGPHPGGEVGELVDRLAVEATHVAGVVSNRPVVASVGSFISPLCQHEAEEQRGDSRFGLLCIRECLVPEGHDCDIARKYLGISSDAPR